MTRIEDRQKALILRKRGMSYSQIKLELGISKSTLSAWLKDMPLSPVQMRELQADSEKRIENIVRQCLAKRLLEGKQFF